MKSTTRVALSGASGKMGSVLRSGLLRNGVALRSAGGRQPLDAIDPSEEVTFGDLREPRVVDALLEGVDVLIHLAGTSVERPLPEVITNNLDALHQVYEGARRNGVRRVVFASSHHAFGMYPVGEPIPLAAPYRPDGIYGLSKVWGEAMARMYWDKHGIEGIALRIGSCEERPTTVRHLSTWLGYEDALELLLCCIRAIDVGYQTVWGVSNNRRSYWTPIAAPVIGYYPQQSADDFAAEILKAPNGLDPTAQRYQGGAFVCHDFTPIRERPSYLAVCEAHSSASAS